MEAIIYLKGHLVRGEGNTNHIMINIDSFSEVDDILEEYGVSMEDINVIDFRFFDKG